LLFILVISNLFGVSSIEANDKVKSFIEGEWKLNLNRTLDDAEYDEGQYIFKMKNFSLNFNPNANEVRLSGIDKYLKDGSYDIKIKSNKQVVIDVTPASKKLISKLSNEPLFNYEQKKIILKKYKNYLIAKYKPNKDTSNLKLYFSKVGEKYKKRKAFKVKYNKLYENIDKTIDKELRYVMFYKNKEVSFSDKPFSEKDKLPRLKFENGSSKKIFINEGDYHVVLASKMFRLYKKDEKGKKHYFKPSK
jgi:hypothetical protein